MFLRQCILCKNRILVQYYAVSGKVQVFVQIQPPFGAVSHIVDEAEVGDEFPGAALPVLAVQFDVRDETGR